MPTHSNKSIHSGNAVSANNCARGFIRVFKYHYRALSDYMLGKPSKRDRTMYKKQAAVLRGIKKLNRVFGKSRRGFAKARKNLKVRLGSLSSQLTAAEIQTRNIILDEVTKARKDNAQLMEELEKASNMVQSCIDISKDISEKFLDELKGANGDINNLNHLREIGDLRGFSAKVFSQNGEDGIIQEIFRRINTTNRFFVEFGVESGEQCNTRYLAECLGWSGVYFEPSDIDFPFLKERWKGNHSIKAFQTAINSSNFESELREANVPMNFDLLVIDIDGNDYWVWSALKVWKPRVVVIEYNAFIMPPRRWVMSENDSHRWNQTTYFGASFASLYSLGIQKGYELVGTDPMGVNMFFVRRDCMNEAFIDPSLHYFFQRFGYMRPPTGFGPYEEI
jgi:hypothetical protein